jgi:hypothetical protein
MSRSRALRLMGGAIVTASVPSVFTSRAWGRGYSECNAKGGGCIRTARCCYTSDGFAGECCPWYVKCHRNGGCDVQYICEDGRNFCGPRGSKICCGTDEICFQGVCIEPCPADQVVCKEQCCPKGFECVRARIAPGGPRTEMCMPKCPRGRSRCGINCCPPRWRCKDPDQSVCRPCGSEQVSCGKKCCNKRTHYCGNAQLELCCPNNSSACPTGYPASRSRTCCPRPNKCARELPQQSGGITASSRYVCCPPDRQVPGATVVCCPPGQVSLGGRLVVGFGIQGLCCKRSQLCGSGANATCCQRFSENIGTDLNQTCCSGKCKTLAYDPENCGSCGQRCAANQRCSRGRCVAA